MVKREILVYQVCVCVCAVCFQENVVFRYLMKFPCLGSCNVFPCLTIPSGFPGAPGKPGLNGEKGSKGSTGKHKSAINVCHSFRLILPYLR